jgi:hypothetical protein
MEFRKVITVILKNLSRRRQQSFTLEFFQVILFKRVLESVFVMVDPFSWRSLGCFWHSVRIWTSNIWRSIRLGTFGCIPMLVSDFYFHFSLLRMFARENLLSKWMTDTRIVEFRWCSFPTFLSSFNRIFSFVSELDHKAWTGNLHDFGIRGTIRMRQEWAWLERFVVFGAVKVLGEK